jgi:hypothetical protein
MTDGNQASMNESLRRWKSPGMERTDANPSWQEGRDEKIMDGRNQC